MPQQEFQPIPLPKEAFTSEPQNPANGKLRFQKQTVGMVLMGISTLLITGVLAEIFHTGQVITSATSQYSASVDIEAKAGLDLFAREIAGGVMQATITISKAVAEARQKVESAKVEADRIKTASEQQIVVKHTVGFSLNRDVGTLRHPTFRNLLKHLDDIRPDLTTSKNLGVGFRYIDPDRGFGGRRVFPVSRILEVAELNNICVFECLQYDWNASRCADEWEPSLERKVQPADIQPSREWALVLSEPQRQTLNVYRQVLRDLEAALFRKALDVERFKKMNSAPTLGASSWLNSELSRLYRKLQNTRRDLHSLSEIEYLASAAQRSGVAAAYQGEDLTCLEFVSQS